MKKTLLIMMLLSLTLGALKSTARAYVQPTDCILDSDNMVIYMVGGNYLRLLSLPYNIDDFDVIYKIDLKDSTREVIYRGVNLRMDKLTLSPDYKYIAAIKGSGSFIKTNEMLIITKDEGKEVVTFKDDIRKYTWSPDGGKIAYITGEDIESRGLNSTGVWVYDIAKNEKKKVAVKANDIEWLPIGDIYVIDYEKKYDKKKKGEIIYNSLVYSYKDKVNKEHKLKGVKFSLDGKYSILVSPQYGDITADENSMRINIYDRRADKLIPIDKLSTIFTEPSRIEWGSFMWVKENRLVFERSIMNSLIRDIIICDIEKNSVLKSVRGQIVGVNSDRSKIVVFREGKFEIMTVP